MDLASYDYELKPLIPGTHVQILKPIVSEAYVPVLQNGETVIQGSGAILDLVERQAFAEPATEEEKEWENKIDTQIGKSLQTILYSFILEHPEIIGKLFQLTPLPKPVTVGPPEHFDLISLVLRKRYKVTPKNTEAVKEVFRQSTDELKKIYSERKFFNGKSFGRVDLTVASLLGNMVLPKECPCTPWLSSVDMPQPFIDWKNSLGAESLYQKVSDFYTEFRIQSK